MPANTNPIFPLTPVVGVANISSANANRTVTGTTGLTIVGAAAGANGRRVDRVLVQATGTTTAGMVRIWYYAGSGNAQLILEIPVTAITPSATQAAFAAEVAIDKSLPATSGALYASTEKAESFNVIAFGGDY